MKKQILSALVLGLGLTGTLSAQHQDRQHRCSTTEYTAEQLRLHPEYQQLIDNAEIESQTNAAPGQPQVIITIPVVFHVVYQNATENINDTRLLEQLAVLNEDYRKTNVDASSVPAAWQGIAADCEIQFCLAVRDANGNATTGIERTQTNVGSFSFNDNVKSTSTGGANAWDRDKYLNIWVCDLGNQLLGYSSIVGGPANVDGVVLHYKYTGKTGASAPYNKGRTATHEVGHWLSLRHIWGDDGGACNGTDFVNDTPNQASENYGCFAVNTVLTDACTPAAPGIMWMNYMDYTDDACMYMFTAGQKTRMVNCLNNTRNDLLTSNGCVPVGINELTLAAALNLFPS
ncbi:MAG: zinc metalloprotease, partial [Bacteroidia bacterium]